MSFEIKRHYLKHSSLNMSFQPNFSLQTIQNGTFKRKTNGLIRPRGSYTNAMKLKFVFWLDMDKSKQPDF